MKIFMKLLCYSILMIITFITFGCDDVSSSEDIAVAEITTALDNIISAFPSNDIDAIMDNYSASFTHDGNTFQDEEGVWLDRMMIYDFISYTDLDIDVDKENNTAEASFILEFRNDNGTDFFMAPSDIGDMTYFAREDLGDWKIIGNKNSSGGYSIQIYTEPSNAAIYLNDNMLYQVTPCHLTGLSQGEYNLKVYLFGYNEVEKNINIPEETSISLNLERPSYPKPKISINYPQEGYHHQQELEPLIITGIIKLEDQYQNLSDYENRNYILNHNYKESEILSPDGTINQAIYVASGINIIQIRSTSADGNTGWSDSIIFYGDY